jgi:hypothetical protein
MAANNLPEYICRGEFIRPVSFPWRINSPLQNREDIFSVILSTNLMASSFLATWEATQISDAFICAKSPCLLQKI